MEVSEISEIQRWNSCDKTESNNDNTRRFILGVGRQIAGTMECACFVEEDQDASG